MNIDELGKDRVIGMAEASGYRLIRTDDWCLVFKKGDDIGVNVYWSARPDRLFTVQTWLNHPKKGKTQLNRRMVNWSLLELIFSNPRAHTKKGYY